MSLYSELGTRYEDEYIFFPSNRRDILPGRCPLIISLLSALVILIGFSLAFFHITFSLESKNTKHITWYFFILAVMSQFYYLVSCSAFVAGVSVVGVAAGVSVAGVAAGVVGGVLVSGEVFIEKN